MQSLRLQSESAEAYADHPVRLRLRELETMRELSRPAGARIYVDFDRQTPPEVRNGAQLE
jgi:hypothetical protein